LLCLAVRWAFLFQPIRYDEAHTFNAFVRPGIGTAVSSYTSPNNHVFHSVLLCGMSTVGRQEWLLRLPALTGGVLSVALAAWLVRRVAGFWPALLSAALMSFNAHQIEYSTNARGYSMVVCCFLTQLACVFNASHDPRPRHWAAFTLATMIGGWTIPIMVYPSVVAGIFALTLLPQVSDKRRYFAGLGLSAMLSWGLTVTLYLPVIFHQGLPALVSNRFVERFDSSAEWKTKFVSLLVETSDEWSYGWPPVVMLLCVALLIASWFAKPRVRWQWLALPWMALVAVSAMIWLQHVKPFPRSMIFLQPLFFITASIGVAALPRRLSGAFVMSCLFSLGVTLALSRAPLSANGFEKFPDAPRVSSHLVAKNHRADQVVLGLLPSTTVGHYWKPARRKPKNAAVGHDWLIVVTDLDETVEGVLSRNRIQGRTTSITLEHRLGRARVYRVALTWEP
jgi:4-amino-4-deoxy-L-arabinose transferase-like glycosyltransferase